MKVNLTLKLTLVRVSRSFLKLFIKKLSNYNLANTIIAIKTHANGNLNALEKFSATVQYKENMFFNFSLYVIAGDGVKLLSRNWISEVKLDWTILSNRCKEKLSNISKTDDSKKLENLLKNYSEIFPSEIGTIKDVKKGTIRICADYSGYTYSGSSY